MKLHRTLLFFIQLLVSFCIHTFPKAKLFSQIELSISLHLLTTAMFFSNRALPPAVRRQQRMLRAEEKCRRAMISLDASSKGTENQNPVSYIPLSLYKAHNIIYTHISFLLIRPRLFKQRALRLIRGEANFVAGMILHFYC